MRKVYVALLGLLFLLIVVQFYLAAVGGFDKPQDDESFAMHRMNGMVVIPIVSVLATVAAALARAPGRLIALTILPVGLVVVQMLIRAVAEVFDTSGGDRTAVGLTIFGLHAINGLAMMVLTRVLFVRAKAFLAVRSPARPVGQETAQPSPT